MRSSEQSVVWAVVHLALIVCLIGGAIFLSTRFDAVVEILKGWAR